jgi:hypothetical protein
MVESQEEDQLRDLLIPKHREAVRKMVVTRARTMGQSARESRKAAISGGDIFLLFAIEYIRKEPRSSAVLGFSPAVGNAVECRHVNANQSNGRGNQLKNSVILC